MMVMMVVMVVVMVRVVMMMVVMLLMFQTCPTKVRSSLELCPDTRRVT